MTDVEYRRRPRSAVLAFLCALYAHHRDADACARYLTELVLLLLNRLPVEERVS